MRLERYGLWPIFHKHLIVELFTSLRAELGDAYWVDMETEILLVPRPSGPARPVAPDASVSQTEPGPSLQPAGTTATPALLEVDEPIGEFEQSWIEVRRRDWPAIAMAVEYVWWRIRNLRRGLRHEHFIS